LQCIDWRYSNQSDASSKVRGLDMALFPAQSLIREVGLRAIEAQAGLLLVPLFCQPRAQSGEPAQDAG
jgi:hypothetical protein